MTRTSTHGTIKLSNAAGAVHWHYGRDMCSTLREAKSATGRVRDCPAVRAAAIVIADSRLRVALQCGCGRLVEVEDDQRRGITVDITLPSDVEAAIREINGMDNNTLEG